MSNLLKAIILDDEQASRNTLRNMLQKYCEGVLVIAEASTVAEAVPLIEYLKPDIVFLDIEMPQENGFRLFEHFPAPTFHSVFVTAYNEHALRAFQMSAIDYLLKPIDLELLRKALDKVHVLEQMKESAKKVDVLKANFNNVLKKLTLPTNDGQFYVNLSEIIKVDSQSNYVIFITKSGKRHIVAKTLKYYESILRDFNFYRVNRSTIVNLNHIVMQGKGKTPDLTMTNGDIVSVSASRKEGFTTFFQNAKIAN